MDVNLLKFSQLPAKQALDNRIKKQKGKAVMLFPFIYKLSSIIV